jgi:hypothetical protein
MIENVRTNALFIFVVTFLIFVSAELDQPDVSSTPKKWQYPEIHLNYSIDPCEDLYEHVCSIWKREHPVSNCLCKLLTYLFKIPPDRTAFSKLSQAAEQIKPILFGKKL